MATKTAEEKLASIFQEVGLERFKQLTKLIMALNTPKRERAKRKSNESARIERKEAF